jgi:phage shock protein B
MTVSMGDALEVVVIVGGLFAALVGVLVIYLLVRSPRRRREAVPPEEDPLSQAEMLALMDRMERRLETLERLVAQDEAPARIAPRREDQISEAVEDREPGRTK